MGCYFGVINSNTIKLLRGNRVCLIIEKNASYESIRSIGLQRMTDFHHETIDESAEYLLPFESGEIAHHIPGTTNDFVLSNYKEEITLYLISQSDKMILEGSKMNPFP